MQVVRMDPRLLREDPRRREPVIRTISSVIQIWVRGTYSFAGMKENSDRQYSNKSWVGRYTHKGVFCALAVPNQTVRRSGNVLLKERHRCTNFALASLTLILGRDKSSRSRWLLKSLSA